MDKPHCVINPKTNRAVKATSALGKKLLKDLENGNKSVVEAQKPVAKKRVAKKTEVKKPEVKKTQPHTMYKQPIGPKVQEIPHMLRELTYFGGAKQNKESYIPGFHNKPIIRDNFGWKLPMLDFQITTHSNKRVIENFDMWLKKIDIHLTLNRKLENIK